jgi:hypothetical protein
MESLTSNGSASPPKSNGKEVDVATTSATQNPLSPVFWQTEFRNESDASVERRHVRTRIQLEDHTEESSDQFKALWAKHVSIDDYVIVSGAVGKLGPSYVCWNCTVEILDVGLCFSLSWMSCLWYYHRLPPTQLCGVGGNG